jgi:hypothetical protein
MSDLVLIDGNLTIQENRIFPQRVGCMIFVVPMDLLIFTIMPPAV